MEIIFDNVTLISNLGTPLEKTLLKDINLTIKDNSITGILGNSNSGKSSIGELINALVAPTKGSVRIGKNFINNGKKIKNINSLRFDVGFVYRNPKDMLFNKTVKQELEFGLKYFKYKNDKKALRTIETLKLVGLDDKYLDMEINNLTLSEQKKICLAAVLIFNPKVLILDEPTIGLNIKEKQELKRIIKLLKDRYDRTIIILSKDTTFLYELCEDLFIFNKSNLVYSGKVDALKNEKMLNSYGIEVPGIIRFTNLARKKGKKIEDYKDIQDLVKAVYRNVF